MLLRLRMIDRSEYPIAILAAVSAWITATPIGAWLALHPLATYAAQALITVACGLLTLVAQHFVRRWLKRNWPDHAGEPGQALKEAAAAGVDLFKFLRPVARSLFDLFRRGISRLRKSKRRRKESQV